MSDTKISALTSGVPAQEGDLIPAAREISEGVYGNVSLTPESIAALAPSVPSDFQAPIVAGAAYTWRSQDFGNDDNPGSNVLMTVPFWCSHKVTWTKIGIVVTAGDPGGVVRLGVYSSNETNRPGDLLLDAGEVDVSVDGIKELDISLPIEANTVVWLASLCNANPDNLATYVAPPFADAAELAVLGMFFDDPLGSASFARAHPYGPLPATCGPGDGDSGRYPLPFLRTGV